MMEELWGKKVGFSTINLYKIMANYADVLTLKSDKCMVVAVARATHPPDGLPHGVRMTPASLVGASSCTSR